MGPRPRPISPCGGREFPEAELMHPNEKFEMTSEANVSVSWTSEAENDEPPPYDWLKEQVDGGDGEEDGHVRPRACVHSAAEQETVEYVEEELGLK